jgi:putative transposase
VLKVVKVRIYPNTLQREKLLQHFGSARFVYNFMLGRKKEIYEKDKTSISAYELKKLLPQMKKTEDFEWLKEIDSTALQNAVLNMDRAYQDFFRRVKTKEKSGFPKFKSRHHSRQSYQASTASVKESKLYLPKIGEVKAKFHRGKITGKIKTLTISCEADQYFASINYEDGKEEVLGVNNSKSIGIDMGVMVFAYTSDNQKMKHINLKKEIANVIKAQKSLSRKKRGSQNRT